MKAQREMWDSEEGSKIQKRIVDGQKLIRRTGPITCSPILVTIDWSLPTDLLLSNLAVFWKCLVRNIVKLMCYALD